MTAPVATVPEPRFRLLPPERRLGWTPFAWLAFLGGMFVQPVYARWSAAGWAVTIVAVAVFLVSYFRAHWLRGEPLLWTIAFHVALGVALSPWNPGAAVFFVYAASFAGQLDTTRAGVRTIAAVVVVAALYSIVTHAPLQYWMVACLMSPLIGGVNLHFAQVARADARLRLAHAEIEHLAAVAERERIARDLHDVLGHTLSLVVLKAELASRLVERDPARAEAEMRDVEQVARRALADVRETVRGYRATLDDELRSARALLETAGIRVEASVALDAPDRARDEVLAMLLREMVTNVVRHSGASRCRITVESDEGVVRLTVDDDGRGGRVREGSGLRGMRERVEAIGGTLGVEATSGMVVTAVLPSGGGRPLAAGGAR